MEGLALIRAKMDNDERVYQFSEETAYESFIRQLPPFITEKAPSLDGQATIFRISLKVFLSTVALPGARALLKGVGLPESHLPDVRCQQAKENILLYSADYAMRLVLSLLSGREWVIHCEKAVDDAYTITGLSPSTTAMGQAPGTDPGSQDASSPITA
jgi:hypothetical protein